MKKLISLFLSLCVLLSLASVAFAYEAGETSVLKMTVDKQSAQIGDTITVTLENKDMTLISFICGIRFDNTLVQVVSAVDSEGTTYGYLTKTSGKSSEAMVFASVDDANESGTVSAVWANATEGSYKASVIMTVTFEAIADGDVWFTCFEDYDGDTVEASQMTSEPIGVAIGNAVLPEVPASGEEETASSDTTSEKADTSETEETPETPEEAAADPAEEAPASEPAADDAPADDTAVPTEETAEAPAADSSTEAAPAGTAASDKKASAGNVSFPIVPVIMIALAVVLIVLIVVFRDKLFSAGGKRSKKKK